MNETKVLAAILTIATSARDARGTSQEVGKEHWRRVIKDYNQIFEALVKQEKNKDPFEQP
jgi:hypothetical protein